MSYLAADSLFPEWKVWTQFLDESTEGLRLDGLAESHPIEVSKQGYSFHRIWYNYLPVAVVLPMSSFLLCLNALFYGTVFYSGGDKSC